MKMSKRTLTFATLLEHMMKKKIDGDPRRVGNYLEKELDSIRARLLELERQNKK